MTKKKQNKKIPSLKPFFEEVLVCKKKENRPFIEILIEEPQNISHQNLGTLIGIFQIDDYSEDSSYIVNYLISIIKKEYFTRPNHGVIESFEAALHKANLALSKLASHENISWIGHLNVVCAVIEKNNLLLSQTGTASALLLRRKTITEITEKMPEKDNLNPLKTFQDVISGRIEKNDKLLFATKELFDLFSLEEIKRSALKFNREKFIRFLDTATVNELDQSAVLVVDIEEKKEEYSIPVPAQNSSQINAFSQKTFRKETPNHPKTKIDPEKHPVNSPLNQEKQKLAQLLKQDSTNFIDKRTGHIYIKEESVYLEKSENKINFFDFVNIKNRFTTHSLKAEQVFKKNLQQFITNLKRSIMKTKERTFPTKVEKKVASLETSLTRKITQEKEKETNQPTKKIDFFSFQKKLVFLTILWIKKIPLKIKKYLPGIKEKMLDLAVLLLRGPVRLFLFAFSQISSGWKKLAKKKFNFSTPKHSSEKSTPIQNPTKPNQTSLLKKSLWPSFSRLIQATKSLDKKQRYFAFLIAFVILIVPYWIASWIKNPTKKAETTIVEYFPPEKIPLENDKNVRRVEKINIVSLVQSEKIIYLNSILFAQAENKIFQPQEQKEFLLPEKFENPELFFDMKDLNLIFVIKNNRIVSLSPVTGKFQTNSLTFPTASRIVDVKTYLTYIYLLDTANNQIYRIPRVEGGFGEKTDWLKEDLNLSEAKSLAINENIFLLNGKNILKLFRGKKVDFSIENTETPILPDKLYAQNSNSILYVLDKTNARIVKLDNDGRILAQFYNQAISDAIDFAINEEENMAYFSLSDRINSFELN